MVWRGEHIFVLGLSSKLWREDLTLNVTIWSNVRDWKSYTLMHHLSVKIFTFHLFLVFPREEFYWIWIWEVCQAFLDWYFLEVRSVPN